MSPHQCKAGTIPHSFWWPEATTTSWPQVLTTMGKNTFCRRVFRPDCIYIAHCNHSRDYNIGTVESHVNCDGVYSVFQYCNMQVNSVCMQWARGGRNSETAVKAGGVYGGNALFFFPYLFLMVWPLTRTTRATSFTLRLKLWILAATKRAVHECVCVCVRMCVFCVCVVCESVGMCMIVCAQGSMWRIWDKWEVESVEGSHQLLAQQHRNTIKPQGAG